MKEEMKDELGMRKEKVGHQVVESRRHSWIPNSKIFIGRRESFHPRPSPEYLSYFQRQRFSQISETGLMTTGIPALVCSHLDKTKVIGKNR